MSRRVKYNNKRPPEEEALLRELNVYASRGCRFCLDGRPSRPGTIAAACLREEGNYMRDLVTDEQEIIREIDFIRVAPDRNKRRFHCGFPRELS